MNAISLLLKNGMEIIGGTDIAPSNILKNANNIWTLDGQQITKVSLHLPMRIKQNINADGQRSNTFMMIAASVKMATLIEFELEDVLMLSASIDEAAASYIEFMGFNRDDTDPNVSTAIN